MPLSLLKTKKHLSPLAWLLVLAIFVPASPHIAQGLVLCIGQGHVKVEAAEAGHHERSVSNPVLTGSPIDVEHPAPALQAASDRSESPCLDLPMPVTADICHQAARSEALDGGALSLYHYRLTSHSTVDRSTGPSHHLSRTAAPVPSTQRSHSTVVLLI